MILANYKPQEVLKHFEAISQIPRGSGNEKAVSDYIADFSHKLGLKTIQDAHNNLIIYKPGNSGTPIILQAHLDMVCEKNTGTVHDFLADPIKLYVDGDYVKAKGTTLGADNGLGVALCMALMESTDIQHPPLEIVLTTEEETGMDGAKNLDFSLLSGKQMLNLDNSDDTKFVLGCAAGTSIEYMIPLKWEEISSDEAIFTINVGGLIGGHSGGDIDKERGNALRILASALAQLKTVRIADISGGMKLNAIPREAAATIAIPKAETDQVVTILEKCKENFANQYRTTDKGLEITWESGNSNKALTAEVTQQIIVSMVLMPVGMLNRSMEIEGLVNASNNLAAVQIVDNNLKISGMARGATGFFNRQTETQIAALAKLTGAQVSFTGRSPAWDYNPNSELRKIAEKCYGPIFGKAPQIEAVHAGLECGLFTENIQGLDVIAIGATTHDLHTPDERLSISSVEKMWKFLKSLLGELS